VGKPEGKRRMNRLLSCIPNNAVSYEHTTITLAVGTALYMDRLTHPTSFNPEHRDSVCLRDVGNTANIHTHNQHQLPNFFTHFQIHET
jgi:hypothetical protein